ncbi:cation:proton antiporter [Borrelia sp. CA_690]|uniref:Sodium:proton antiporter n=1 Tax=Borrelia maritima TaxID=2761123 RepID=A0A5J6WBC5_9SPIR|nr:MULTISPECIES: cation:proton antiporter [Borrelia]QFI14566.1 sodium:proton antiporter [Borrelia maritima]WKC84421.1 cation:proton antiporter [Borrelia sp. CA_690]
MNKKFYYIAMLLHLPNLLFSYSTKYDIEIQMSYFVMSLAIIVISSIVIGNLVTKIGIPKVIGQITAGIILSPNAFGKIQIPLLFPLGITQVGENYLINEKIFAISTIASIILLFTAGLETDLKLFIKFLPRGGIIGITEVVGTFTSFVLMASIIFNVPLISPTSLFIGIIGTPTSAGIAASILSAKKKMSTSEGVTIISTSIIDDVLSMLMLTSVITISRSISDLDIASSIKAIIQNIVIWLCLTFSLIYVSETISRLLKKLNSVTLATVITLSLALTIASIFQNLGMSFVVGAYVFGLAMSKTDIVYVIQDKLTIFERFFIPIFFTSIGLMSDINEILSKEVLILGLAISAIAIITKSIFCFIPALFLGFNKLGALKIATGMVPRGEVSLIMANVALSSGFISQKIFGIIIIMVFLPTIIATPIINFLFKINKSGLKKELPIDQNTHICVSFEYDNLAKILIWDLKNELRKEGFFTQQIKNDSSQYINARKNNISFSIKREGSKITFECPNNHLIIMQDLFRETILNLEKITKEVETVSLRAKKLDYSINYDKLLNNINLNKRIKKENIILKLKASNKADVIRELLSVINIEIDKERIFQDLMEREKLITTALKEGFAIPHLKTNLISKIHIAIGISHEGIDFNALDKNLSHVFILILCPAKDYVSYPRILASVVGKVDLYKKEILNAKTDKEIYNIIVS